MAYIYYYLLPVCATVCYILSLFLTHRLNNLLFLRVVFILLFVIVALRGITVGTDTSTYSGIFNSVTVNYGNDILLASKVLHIELGYITLNSIVGLLNGNYFFLQLIVSSFTMASFYYLIKKGSNDYLLSILIFLSFGYYFLTMNISRQFLAFSVNVVSFFLMRQEKWKCSLIVIFIAGLIHNSGFLFLFIWLTSMIKISKRKFVLIFSSFFILALPIAFIIRKLMMSIVRYSLGMNNSNAGKGIVGISFSVITIFLFIIFWLNYNFINDDVKDRILLYLMLFIMLFNVLTLFLPLLGRIRYIFEPYLVVLIPYINNKLKLMRYRIVIDLSMLVIGIFVLIKLVPNNVFYGVIPYTFFWQ